MSEIQNIKDEICNILETKKQESINEYDSMIVEISNENNIAKLCHSLSEVFHNTMEQGELELNLLKKYLTNNFFKTAETKNGVNYIQFFNDEFEVWFSKSLTKEIKIKFNNPCVPRTYYPSVHKSLIKMADLIEVFLNKKSIRNFKALIDCNCINYRNNIFAQIMKPINTYRKCNKELLEKIRDSQQKDKIKRLQIEEETKTFKGKQLYAKAFIDSLTDLEQFKVEGWNIRYIGIEDEKGTISYC
jgi:hypothetical protein